MRNHELPAFAKATARQAADYTDERRLPSNLPHLLIRAYSCSFVLCKGGENMGIWEYMKTTIELPEALFRRAKSMAVQEGVTLKQLLTEALESQLDARRSLRNGNSAAPRWMRA